MKAPSSLRHDNSTQAPTYVPKHATISLHSRTKSADEPRATPAKRFIFRTPQRHAMGSVDRDTGVDVNTENRDGETWFHTPTLSRAAPPRLSKLESIEDNSPASSLEIAEQHSIIPSVEPGHHPESDGTQSYQTNEDEDEEILFVTEERHKRRRVTPQPPPDSLSSPPSRRIDHRQVRTPVPAPHRFKVPAPKTPATFDHYSTAPGAASSHRPQFILPVSSPSPTKAATPLPETFSPSRKNGKYIPGGLASTLQSWVMETAETGYSTRTSGAGGTVWGRDRDDGVKMRVRVTRVSGSRHNEDGSVECWAGCFVFVHGSTEATLYNASRASSVYQHMDTQEDGGEGNGTGVQVLLVGQGGVKGQAGVRIREDTIIGIRAPLWDVDVGGGAKWVVGVDWVVLS